MTTACRSLHQVPAPAKLNLFLHLVGRRDDGYHLLQSVFMLIDWGDSLDFTRRDDGTLSREDVGSLALPENDLCMRAARLLKEVTGTQAGADIRLHKYLPAEAGMGGGSSDAATTLLALNRLWGTGMKRQELMQLGQRLGADVPFFIAGQNAWVEGIGERITPVTLPVQRWVVVKPAHGVSTKTIFSSEKLARNTKTAIISGFAANDTVSDVCPALNVEQMLAEAHNDMEPVARELCPEIDHAIKWLGEQGLKGRMTGSGSAVFAPRGHDRPLASAPPGWTVRECCNLAVHPLRHWCSD
ncbi:4-(cytidine 5'-diphospho)-2-C-methyl-D-erythritol kinase [Hydrogenophaga sp. 5NK40-0174]|uniref:4-(cytidine 5'-diphospho)-2-C-methyl-D-erythritol kinase n=1 Tax=Hydrogenophaga sp. 5NK40-0174 TaxID=3127649 RepID=UPI00310B4FA1